MQLRILGAVIAIFITASSQARVVSVEIDTREDVLGGKSFGLPGSYERITGTLRFAVDPSNSANRIITDIDLAPRNAEGEVEFSSQFFMLKPITCVTFEENKSFASVLS